ncbi:MAG: zinc-binding dehydrogenase [Eubacterium sp.]|nr:zinc-binding dehydrogenase [Eubacterium sp.]
MKAVVIYEAGGPEKLIYTDVPVPEVKPGWSLVRVMGRGVNHSEIFTRNGLSPSVSFPRILGIECVGVIAKTTDPERLPAGLKVISIMGEMGRAFDGGYAEYALLPNEQIYPVDTELPWDILAAVPETYYTAYGSMKNLRIFDGSRILVRGGTSGVGIAFMRLVKAGFPSAHVTGTTRNPEKAEMLLKAGFDAAVTDRDNLLQTDACFDRIFDLIGPAALQDTFAHTAAGGIICVTGLLGGKWTLDAFDPLEDLPPNSYLTSFHSGNISAAAIQEMLNYVSDHHVDVRPEKVFSLSEMQQAHAYLESSESFGKVVVLSDGTVPAIWQNHLKTAGI